MYIMAAITMSYHDFPVELSNVLETDCSLQISGSMTAGWHFFSEDLVAPQLSIGLWAETLPEGDERIDFVSPDLDFPKSKTIEIE